MELSPTVLDTIDVTSDKDVMEVLKQTVTEDDIIFESETTEDSVETEVEEIIEIIEEVEESEESMQEYVTEEKELRDEQEEVYKENSQSEQFDKNSTTQIYTFEEDGAVFKQEYAKGNTEKRLNDDLQSNNGKQVITYDADEDWQDDEIEHLEELDEEMEHEIAHEKRMSLSESSSSSRNTVKSSSRSDKTQLIHDLENNEDDLSYIDNDSNHEIVKNTENNLVYTVLGSKKQNTKQSQQEKIADAHYIKMEQLNDNTVPVEGTIYYEGDNMERLYVAQAVDDNEQYHYEGDEQQEQAWDVNSDANQNQEEDNSQDQIFLHEDEDGQLYFKDDNGILQPVYLTEDGNYAIAENSDDQDSKESEAQNQQSSRETEEDTFIIPDLEVQPARSNKQTAVVPTSAFNELDNEDNTVTISLIISEDENGQKRTQVIIPTTDNLKCDICNKSFKTSFQLLRHNRLKHAREENITTRNFPCDQCPKRYPDQNSLARHRKTHTGDRPFQCLECHKNFPTSTALRRHLTLHNSQSRPLPCIYCGRRFLEKSSLMKHEESHLAGDRHYTCDICHKSFMNANDLSMHKKHHDPDKKFDCEVCGREFNRLNNLQRHMMVHQQQGANEEILACDVCGITYKFMSSLTRHMVTTHMNPEKLRQQAEEQRRKREHNYRKYLENRRMYETHHSGGYGTKRSYSTRHSANNDDAA